MHSEDKTVSAAPCPDVFTCRICGDCFSSQEYLDKHIQDYHARVVPQGKLGCSYCPYTSNHQQHITAHERIHTGARPFSCLLCKKSFRDQQRLSVHQRIHTREKPYECTDCGQKFSVSCSLARHRRHLHSNHGKPHACPHCGRAFTEKYKLATHLITHTGEKPYACRMCDQRFTQRVNARQHERRMHTGQNPHDDSDSARDADISKIALK